MSALMGIVGLAALFMVFGVFHRHGARPVDCGACGRRKDESCHICRTDVDQWSHTIQGRDQLRLTDPDRDGTR